MDSQLKNLQSTKIMKNFYGVSFYSKKCEFLLQLVCMYGNVTYCLTNSKPCRSREQLAVKKMNRGKRENASLISCDQAVYLGMHCSCTQVVFAHVSVFAPYFLFTLASSPDTSVSLFNRF